MTTIHAEIVGQGRIALLAGGLGDPEDVAQAAKRLKTLTPLFSKSDPPGALVTALTWPAIVQLSHTYGSAWRPGPRLAAWISDQVVARTRPLPQALPDWMTFPEGLAPRPYQVSGAHEIARTGRALIFDEPRTGKTITTILGLALAAGPQHEHGLPILVVCPASVVDPWVEAFSTWTPYWRAVAWRGPKRRALAGQADVYVTSYETARLDANEMQKAPLVQLQAASVVVDETHYIKNHVTHRARAVRRLAKLAAKESGSFVGLSGTPITHHPADLWPILDCLTPDAQPSGERWKRRYCEIVPGEYDDQILGLLGSREPEFRLTIVGQHRRVARADVMGQLPPKVYSVRTVDLPPSWRKVYDDFEAEMLAELPDGQELQVMDALSVFTHLSGLASAPADVEVTYGPDVSEQTGEPKRHVSLKLKASSWKVAALLEILEERCGQNGRDRVVAFAPSKQLMLLAGEAATKAGYRVGYILGGQTPAVRTATIRAFQSGELDLVCATTGAGGTGITLSTAGTLVFLQRPWALVESIQAEDRGEGDMNATRGTEIVDIVARNTLDTRIRAVLRERGGQLADLLQDPRILRDLLGGHSAQRDVNHPRGAASSDPLQAGTNHGRSTSTSAETTSQRRAS